MFNLLTAIILILHVVLLASYLYLTWYHNYWKKRGVITAQPLTLFGTYPSLFTRKRNVVYDIQDVYDRYRGKHRAVGAFLTRKPQLLVLDPKLATEVLVSNFSNFRDSLTSSFVSNQNAHDRYVSRNPFWAGGDWWKKTRQDTQGGVTLSKLKQAYTIWEQNSQNLLKYLDYLLQNSKDKIVESKDLSYRFAAAVMSDFIWGIDVGTLSHTKEPNVFLETASKWTMHTFSMLGIFFATIVAPISRKFFRFYPRDTDDFFAKLTKDSLDLRLKSPPSVERNDYLSYMLQLKEQKQASHDDLVGVALTLLLDGYETTGTALLHALYYLANSPAAQQKLRSEILENLEADKSISFETLNSLPYMDQCMFETLRMASLIPHYSRICTKPLSIEISDGQSVTIEPGVIVTIPNYQYHNDSEYFPEPDKFRPERFDNGAHQELTKECKLIPFGNGPRICIGQRTATLTIKLALVHILSEYEILPTKHKVERRNASSFDVSLAGDIMLEYKKLN